VGHIEPISRKDLKDHGPAVHAGDLVGASGLELGLDDVLTGEPRVRLSVVDRSGRPLEVLARKRGKPGRDVRTTLDIDVQRAAENAYGSTTGGAIVMDPKTGDLLAVVSSSPFDPNNYAGVAGIEPFNRALSGLYPPGSSLKAMTGAAALESKVVRESTPLTGPQEYMGVRNFESGEFGTIDFATAVRFSVNTAFAQVAEDLGARRLTRFADAFGFNRKPSMQLDAASSSFPFPEDLGDLMWGSIGQAQVLATPLQMATIAATIANDGKRMEPRIELRGPKESERVVSRRTAAIMTRLMENVVQGGTGTAANIAGARVAGKTGTAEVDVNGQRRNHAWFICFAPANDPEVAVAVVSELGGVGGEVAAPLARGILSSVLPLVR
jgi:peptidoglycan glycosyltransferase